MRWTVPIYFLRSAKVACSRVYGSAIDLAFQYFPLCPSHSVHQYIATLYYVLKLQNLWASKLKVLFMGLNHTTLKIMRLLESLNESTVSNNWRVKNLDIRYKNWNTLTLSHKSEVPRFIVKTFLCLFLVILFFPSWNGLDTLNTFYSNQNHFFFTFKTKKANFKNIN